jgi:ABC-type transport system substrate-binding protein
MFRTGQILANYWNPEFNNLLEQGQTTMDPKKRQQIYSKADRIFVEDAPSIALYQQIDNYGVNKRVQWTARSDERIEGFNISLKQ